MKVEVVVNRRRPRVSAASLAAFVRRTVRAAPNPPGDGIVVVLVGDVAMRRLNARFRRMDKTTDVLSFPGEGVPQADGSSPLGEIVISVPQAARQALEAG